MEEYWSDAADVVEHRAETCPRSDGADIYWDSDKRAIVIVKDGTIVTYDPPRTGKAYFTYECSQ